MLAGGVGAARLLRGLSSLIDPAQLTVIVNTGDDESFFGLHVSPDLDTILYTLADLSDPQQGWGRRGDSFRCLESLGKFYADTWFRLGDLDLATHIYRTDRLRCGASLSTVTAELAGKLGVRARILPMSDVPVRTFVSVRGQGPLPFQQYLVRDRGEGEVQRITPRGARAAAPAAGVLAAIERADLIILPPSNPFVSIGPIVSLPGVRERLRHTAAPVIAISPLIGNRPVKGPLHRMMTGLGYDVSAVEIARIYRDIVDVFVLDRRDHSRADAVRALGIEVITTDTIMTTRKKAVALAHAALNAYAVLRQPARGSAGKRAARNRPDQRSHTASRLPSSDQR